MTLDQHVHAWLMGLLFVGITTMFVWFSMGIVWLLTTHPNVGKWLIVLFGLTVFPWMIGLIVP